MSGQLYETVGKYLEAATAIVYGVCLPYFLGCFQAKTPLSGLWSGDRTKNLDKKNYDNLPGSCGRIHIRARGIITALLFSVWEIFGSFFSEIWGGGKLIRFGASWQLVISAVLVFLIARYLFCLEKRLAVFTVVTFFAVISLGSFLVHLVAQAGEGASMVLLWCMRRGYLPEGDAGTILMETMAAIFLSLIYVVFWAVIFFSLRKTAHDFPDLGRGLKKAEFRFLVIPGGMGILLCILLRLVMFVPGKDGKILLYDWHPATRLLVPALLFLALLLIVYAVKLFRDLIFLNREKNEKAVLEAQLEGMVEQVRQLEHVCAGVRELRHDMKSTFAVILQLSGAGNPAEESGIREEDRRAQSGTQHIADGKEKKEKYNTGEWEKPEGYFAGRKEKTAGYAVDEQGKPSGYKVGEWEKTEGYAAGRQKELESYLEGLGSRLSMLEMKFHTGNIVADALLHAKWLELSGTLPGLQFDVDDLCFPEKMSLNSYDLGIILGNALENASEACGRFAAQNGTEHMEESEFLPGKGAFIRIRSFWRKRMFFLEIENSFDGKLRKGNGAEFPATTKEEKEGHGIGLANIKRIAEKYQGAVDWSVKEHVFTLSVMVNGTDQ